MGETVMGIVVHSGRLRWEMARRGWSAAELARHAGVTAPTVGSALAGRAITSGTFMRIAQALALAPVIDIADTLLMSDPRDREID